MKLLIIACSGQKAPARCRALDLYQTRQHRLVADAMSRDDDLLVSILSAKEGLVDAGILIDGYEQVMTAERADELKVDEFQQFKFAADVVGFDIDEVLVYGGELYRDVVAAWAGQFDFPVTMLTGNGRGCGDHFAALKGVLA